MEDPLINVFGLIVQTSRNTGLDIIDNYKQGIGTPKKPDEEQSALLELIKGLDDNQFKQLQKGLKYCLELSLFKLVSTIENGVSQYSFDLSIRDGKKATTLVGEKDLELSLEFWNWMRQP